MQRKTLFQFSIIAVLFIALVYGFLLSDDKPTTAADFMVFGTPDVITHQPILTDAIGTWSQGANVITPRYHGQGTGFQRNDTGWIYFIGGDQSGSGSLVNSNHRYNINTNVWTAMAVIPPPVPWYSCAATLGNFVYVGPGLTDLNFSSANSVLQRYSINTDSWTTMAPLPIVTAMSKLVGYQDTILYLTGGFIGGGTAGGTHVYLYNATSNAWRLCTPLPAARCGHAAAITGDTLVVIGGATSYSTGITNVVYRGVISQADRSVITWTTGAPYPVANHRLDAQNYFCKGIITSPGSVSGFTPSNSCYTYLGNVWTAQPNITMSTSAAHTGAVRYINGLVKFVVASGLILQAPFSIPNTQIYTDTCAGPPALPNYCRCETSAYVPLVGGTPGPSGDDATITVPIPFTFTYAGTGYTQASICTNGFTVLGSSTYNSFTVNLCQTTPANSFPMLAPYWVDLNTLTAGNITYATLGTAGNRIFVVDYNNVGYFGGGPGRVNMQLRLYENGNRVIFHYGGGVTGTALGHVGINKSPGGSGNIHNIVPGPTCPVTTSTTNCTNVAYNVANFPSGRSYLYECPVGIEPVTNGIPREYKLSQNYPNPFNPATKISYALPKAGNVKLVVYDLLGREVAVLVNEFKKAGTHDIDFNASGLSSGVYLYKIESGEFIDTKRMMLIK